MSNKYAAYPEYKDSGLEWLGQIPAHWDVKKLKFLGDAIIGLTYSPEEVVDAISGTLVLRSSNVQDGKLAFNDNVYVSKSIPSKLRTQKGDILICSRNGSRALIGKNAIIDESAEGASFGAFMSIFRSRYNEFLSKVFNSSLFDYQAGTFLTSTINQLTTGNLNNFEVPFPPESERNQIAAFLDYETARIDQLIAKQQRLIELLKEKRQAVISHAVTKGLNPNAPMKDSGVEWLGQVPEHWVVTKAKYVSQVFVPQRNKPELNESQGYPWVTMEDMTNQYIVNPSRFVSSEAMKLAGSRLLPSGSVIASCVGNLGVASINTQDVIINQQLQAFIPISIKAEYLKHIVRVSKPYFELIGTAATLVYVNQEGFENMPMLVPSAEEQEKICHLVFDKDIKFMTLIAKAEHKVKLLQERRTALISAAVTGKIDVRDWTPPKEG